MKARFWKCDVCEENCLFIQPLLLEDSKPYRCPDRIEQEDWAEWEEIDKESALAIMENYKDETE
jgi:hypothetical protein